MLPVSDNLANIVIAPDLKQLNISMRNIKVIDEKSMANVSEINVEM